MAWDAYEEGQYAENVKLPSTLYEMLGEKGLPMFLEGFAALDCKPGELMQTVIEIYEINPEINWKYDLSEWLEFNQDTNGGLTLLRGAKVSSSDVVRNGLGVFLSALFDDKMPSITLRNLAKLFKNHGFAQLVLLQDEGANFLVKNSQNLMYILSDDTKSNELERLIDNSNPQLALEKITLLAWVEELENLGSTKKRLKTEINHKAVKNYLGVDDSQRISQEYYNADDGGKEEFLQRLADSKRLIELASDIVEGPHVRKEDSFSKENLIPAVFISEDFVGELKDISFRRKIKGLSTSPRYENEAKALLDFANTYKAIGDEGFFKAIFINNAMNSFLDDLMNKEFSVGDSQRCLTAGEICGVLEDVGISTAEQLGKLRKFKPYKELSKGGQVPTVEDFVELVETSDEMKKLCTSAAEARDVERSGSGVGTGKKAKEHRGKK